MLITDLNEHIDKDILEKERNKSIPKNFQNSSLPWKDCFGIFKQHDSCASCIAEMNLQ